MEEGTVVERPLEVRRDQRGAQSPGNDRVAALAISQLGFLL